MKSPAYRVYQPNVCYTRYIRIKYIIFHLLSPIDIHQTSFALALSIQFDTGTQRCNITKHTINLFECLVDAK